MMKKIATGFLAVAATTALALSLPSAANATTASPATSSGYDFDDYWGPIYARHHLAKAQGWVGVEWDEDQESNNAHVRGRLYDLDNRTYHEGGKCAYVKFQASDFDHHWSTVYTKKYCGYPGYKKFHFETDDVFSLRAKVCQVRPYSNYVTKCGDWDYLYTAETE
ncbi:hypothetical protein [Nonomuraea lactucae]|uniref:hypothetical protein n=1 Tax=Nonomuraea lactucae TaxID=2249762 RepID=UPI000DE213F7|nr:hypothetical protein [Nonomuraea lactucae]